MTERRSEFGYEDLLACGRGELFGAGNAQLPLPPMLMFERIPLISEDGGANGKGQVTAEMAINGNPQVEWFFGCHFKGDPVMPGCLGLDALWQLTGFFLGWIGAPGRGRALGVGEVKFTGMVTPETKKVEYIVDMKRVILRKLKLGIADGVMKAPGNNLNMVDTHAHLGDVLFDPDRPEVLARARAAGVATIVTVSEGLSDAERNLELASSHPELKAAAGLLPPRRQRICPHSPSSPRLSDTAALRLASQATGNPCPSSTAKSTTAMAATCTGSSS